jgi:hypothetical protein
MHKSDLSNLEFYNNLYLYLIPIIQFFILLIPFLGTGALYDGRNKIFHRFSYRGYSLLFLALILIVITINQSHVTTELNKINSAIAKRDSDIRDSITTKKYLDADYKTKVMLAKYGLKVDAQSDKIVKILKDPDQRKVTIKNGENPFIEIMEMRFDKGVSNVITLNLTSYMSTSYDFCAKIDIIAVIDGRLFLVTKNETLTDNLSIPVGYKFIRTWKLDPPNVMDISYLYFHIYGTYKKESSTGSIIPLDKYAGYDFQTPTEYSIPSHDKIAELKKLVNEN